MIYLEVGIMRNQHRVCGAVVVGVLWMFCALMVSAVPIAVYPSGETFDSIQAAIDAADAGSTIVISGGAYAENLIITKPLTVIGYDFISFSPKDPEQPAVRIVDTEHVVLMYFDIGGAAVGIEATNSSFRMSECLLQDVGIGVKILAMDDDVVVLQDCLLSGASSGLGVRILGNGRLDMITCDFDRLGTGAMLAGLSTVSAYACNFNACYDGLVISDTVHATLISNWMSDCYNAGIRIAEVPLNGAFYGSIVLVDNTIEGPSETPISMCNSNGSEPFVYAGELRGLGNRIFCDPSTLCSGGYIWPDGLFCVDHE